MELVVLLLSLSKQLAKPDFKSAEAVSALGRVISQNPHSWVIEPNDARFSKAELSFEDLNASRNLLTSIEITLREPWHTEMASLQSAFGDQFRWMPPPPDGLGDRILQLEPKTGPLACVVMLTVSNKQGQKVTVSKILLRRFYPSPKKLLTREKALTLAEMELRKYNSDQTFTAIEEKTVERPFGWVFFFKAKEAIPGLGPVAVERDTGRVHSLRPSADPEQVISEFEKTLPTSHRQ